MTTLPFITPFTASGSGATGSGKTTWLYKLLQHPDMFDKPFHKILYCYGVWQKLYDDMEQKLYIEFHEGLASSDKIDEFADGKHNLIILDDLASDVSNSSEAEQLYTRGSHHKNLSVIYINQNLYQQGKCSRNIALNSHYTILFKNPRDVTQITNFGRQMGISKLLQSAYKDAISIPYNPLVIDLSPHSDEEYKLRSNIFGDPIIYQ